MTLPDSQASIGIFDSGFGGLTVMRAIRELMPHENILYFGDTARLPYGSKSQETILRYSMENATFLATQGIKILVIACNTACCAALNEIRNRLPIPVVGITEQGIEEVVRLFPQGKVALLGTRATIFSGIYQHQLHLRAPQIELFPLPCPLFVPLVEEGYVDHPMSHLIAHEYLAPIKTLKVQGALLGCTHYPLLTSAIQSVLGSEVQLIDPAIACAVQTQLVLRQHNLLNQNMQPPRYQFFASDDPEKFRLLGQTLLNHPIDHVLLKTPEHPLIYELQKTSLTH